MDSRWFSSVEGYVWNYQRKKIHGGKYNECQKTATNASLYYPKGIHIFNHDPYVLDGVNNKVNGISFSTNPLRIITEEGIYSQPDRYNERLANNNNIAFLNCNEIFTNANSVHVIDSHNDRIHVGFTLSNTIITTIANKGKNN